MSNVILHKLWDPVHKNIYANCLLTNGQHLWYNGNAPDPMAGAATKKGKISLTFLL